jgi:NACalpha-BTF3-like transcription factor
VLCNPYIAGVERFEVPFSASPQANEPFHQLEHAAQFCLLLWQQFQPALRTMRYTLNRDYQADAAREFTQEPHRSELINFDIDNVQQIDIELISQQTAISSRNPPAHLSQRGEHYPAFLEVFIPLHRNHAQPETSSSGYVSEYVSESRLVIWCRPDLLPNVIALWERAAALLVNPS